MNLWNTILSTAVNFLLIFFILEANSSVNKRHKTFYNPKKATELFSEFVHKYNKNYSNDETEYARRLKIFKENLVFINKMNNESEGVHFDITEFSDMKKRERDEKCSCFLSLNRLSLRTERITDPKFCGSVPDKWDWRSYNLVTPAKSQGNCGSCWAISAVGAIETLHAIKHNELIVLSAQQLIDCTSGGHCGGGLPNEAIDQVGAKYGGIASEADYPYEGSTGSCRAVGKVKRVNVVKALQYWLGDEDYLRALIYNRGPIMLGMQTGGGFDYYGGGIASSQSFGCVKGEDLKHAILAVGYGEESGTPYWIIKNSYGPGWGERGYFRMLRGKNTCSILSYVISAVIR